MQRSEKQDIDRQPEMIAVLSVLSPDHAPTPLLPLPALAQELGIAQLHAKDEGRRALGSFKSLGGTYAGLRALARHAHTDIATVIARRESNHDLPMLICASDGNHGLAVAAAARHAGSRARVYLHAGVPESRARRISAMGAEILRIEGTYDDTVDAALHASRRGEGILVADTSEDADDPVVADVVDGYGVIACEARRQYDEARISRPTHVFVQAGVGGLAAAMADGLCAWMDRPAQIVVVEPESVACVEAALERGSAIRLAGDLETSAEMLSCGEASVPALRTLLRFGAKAVRVSEDDLARAVERLAEDDVATTPSGAAGLAGLMVAAAHPELSGRLGLDATSRVMIIVSEAALADG
jgi:diaminopropionate ammonia-lyase